VNAPVFLWRFSRNPIMASYEVRESPTACSSGVGKVSGAQPAAASMTPRIDNRHVFQTRDIVKTSGPEGLESTPLSIGGPGMGVQVSAPSRLPNVEEE
jgi:hypothetical protein